MVFMNSIKCRNDSYYLVRPGAQEAQIPTSLFFLFYDTFYELSKTHDNINHIKPKLWQVLQEKGKLAPDLLQETVNTLFHFTLDTRAALAESLIRKGACSPAEFNLLYSLKPCELPNREHIFWDPRKFIDLIHRTLKNEKAEKIKTWQEQNPAISNLTPLKNFSAPEDTILQQIIQFFIQKELDKEDSTVDTFFINIDVYTFIGRNQFLKELFKNSDFRTQITNTRNLMISSDDLKERRGRIKGKPPVPQNGEPPSKQLRFAGQTVVHHPIPAPVFDVNHAISTFIDDCYQQGLKLDRKELINLFRSKHNLNVSFDQQLSYGIIEKNKAVIAHEIHYHCPHLLQIQPVIIRKAYKELDDFVQRLIQWEISQSSDNYKIVANILSVLCNPRLAPLFYKYDDTMIFKRIKETRRVNS